MYGCDPNDVPEDYSKLETVLRMRRSVRSYKPDAVPSEQIQELLNMTRFAPSSKNQRGVQFVVLSRTVMEELA